jgi:hypothetical protein
MIIQVERTDSRRCPENEQIEYHDQWNQQLLMKRNILVSEARDAVS